MDRRSAAGYTFEITSMDWKQCGYVLAFFLLTTGQVHTAEPEAGPMLLGMSRPRPPEFIPVQAINPQEQPQNAQNQNQNQDQREPSENRSSTNTSNTSDQSAQTGDTSAGFSPQMVGDFPGAFGLRSILVSG